MSSFEENAGKIVFVVNDGVDEFYVASPVDWITVDGAIDVDKFENEIGPMMVRNLAGTIRELQAEE